MHPGDTIAAIASAPGQAPRALLRCSGPRVPDIIDALFEGVGEDRGAYAARLRMPIAGDRLAPLPCVVLRAREGASYTAERTLEALIPGNPILARRALEAICAVPGVREAGPGEFSARAYLNGRLPLDRAEGVAAVIAARTEAQLDAARELLRGAAGKRARARADELAQCLALVEAGVDFTDQEDVVPIPPNALDARLAALVEALDGERGPSASSSDAALPLVVLAGRPSAGKSTLFNALLGRRRAVTAPEPGTTRDVLRETLDLSADLGLPMIVELADAAGLDASPAGAIAADARARALEAVASADLVLHCDPTGRFDPADLAPAEARATVRVRTKADLPHAPADTGVDVCALDGFGLGALRRAIADACAGVSRAGERAAATPMRRRALADAAEAIRRAREHIDPRAHALDEPELVAGELRRALDALGVLTGRVTPDDIIGRVFATFCVGK